MVQHLSMQSGVCSSCRLHKSQNVHRLFVNQAVENGHLDTARVLLKAGARQIGSMEGTHSIFQLLKFDMIWIGWIGTNPIRTAVDYNQYKILKELLKVFYPHIFMDGEW